MKKNGLFFIFALICVALSCCFSKAAHAQRRQIEPIIKAPPNGGGSSEEESQRSASSLSPKKLFQYARIRYQYGDYAKAESLFAEYKKVSSDEPATEREPGLLMHAKTLVHLDRAQEGISELNTLRLTLTTASLRQEALFDLAAAEFRNGEHNASAQHFIEVAGHNWSMEDSVTLRKKAVTNLRLLGAAHLSADDLLKIANSTAYINLRAVLLSESLQKCLAADVLSGRAGKNGTPKDERFRINWQDSLLKRQLIPAINRLLGTPSLDPVCKAWLETGLKQADAVMSGNSRAYRIGVVIPVDIGVFDGTDAQKIGAQILSGIIYRARRFNQESATDYVSIFVRDTRGQDGTHLTSVTNALIEQDSVQLVLGPIFSDQAVVVSRTCAAKGITMITPTATDEKITLGIKTSFQVNPTHNMRGRAIAAYLMEFPAMKTFGIFAERNTYGVEMAEGFRQEVLSKGGTVKIYSMLQPKFSNLKKSMDTLNVRYKGKLKGYQERQIDAIYLPMTNFESIGIALSQLRFYNVSGQIVGSGDWHDLNILHRYEDLLNGVIYAMDSYISYDDPKTAEILTGYESYWQSRKAALFWNGYDALDYLVHTLVSTRLSDRTMIAGALMAAPAYKTAHSEIYFGGGNINRKMNILQYQNGVISKIR